MTPFHKRGNIEIYLGDCLDVLSALAGRTFAAVVADPPYSSGGLYRADRAKPTASKYLRSGGAGRPDFAGDGFDQRAFTTFTRLWMDEARKLAEPGAYLFCFTDWRQLPATTDAIQLARWHWRGISAWDKGPSARAPNKNYMRHQAEFVPWATNGPFGRDGYGPGAGPFAGVFTRHVAAADKLHQAGKPVDTLAWLLEAVRPGGAVLDPFTGSGTALIAAARLGLPAVGIELDEGYAEIAAKRLDAEAEADDRAA